MDSYFSNGAKRPSEQMRQEDVRQRYSRRLHFGETPLTLLKAALDLRRFLLHGHQGVQQEWLWGCTAYNLKKLIRLWDGLRAKRSAKTTVAVSNSSDRKIPLRAPDSKSKNRCQISRTSRLRKISLNHYR